MSREKDHTPFHLYFAVLEAYVWSDMTLQGAHLSKTVHAYLFYVLLLIYHDHSTL